MSTAPHLSYVTLEPPDVIFWHLIGRVDASDIRRIYAEQLAFSAGKPYILVILDVTQVESITADGRRAAAEGPSRQSMPVRGSVVVGASFHFRVLSLLVSKAAQLIHRHEDNPLHFVDTLPEARAWIEERRRVLRQK